MSYISPRTDLFFSRSLKIAQVGISGSPALNSYFDLTVDQDTYASSPTVSASVELNLSAGKYAGFATLSATRSDNSDNYQFQAEIDGTLTGKSGQTAAYLQEIYDSADFEFELANAGVFKLKAIGIENNAPTLESGQSKIFLWRVSL